MISAIFSGLNQSGTWSVDTALTYGVSSKVDLNLNWGGIYEEEGWTQSNFFLMPRYEFYPDQLFGLMLKYDWTENSWVFAPQYHTIYDKKTQPWSLVVNLSYQFYAKKTKEFSSIIALIAPVYKIIPDFLYLYLEFDPYYKLGGETQGVHLDLFPGLWIGLKDGQYQISVSGMLKNVIHPSHEQVEYGAGAYFSVQF